MSKKKTDNIPCKVQNAEITITTVWLVVGLYRAPTNASHH